VIDDTQALGIVGRDAAHHPPYGLGGGGSLRLAQVTSPEVLIVSSLAKAFGVPVAMVAGPASLVERYERRSQTRVHCSPPSIAHIHAAEHALEVNLRQGEQRRARLAALVRQLQDGAGALGHRTGPSQFPVQSLEPIDGVTAALLYRRLLSLRVRAVLHRPACRPTAACSFLITAVHNPGQIEGLLAALCRAIPGPSTPSGPRPRPPCWAPIEGAPR
jgi:8-amino-7-oxononanoate synthase